MSYYKQIVIDLDIPFKEGLTDDGSVYLKEMGWDSVQELKPEFDSLADKGLAPRINFITRKDSLWAVMTPIKGPEVFDLYTSDPDKLYSTGFAQSLARLCLGLYEVKLWHDDLHGFNVLLEEETDRCVVVDLDSCCRRGRHQLPSYISEYVDLLLSAYIGGIGDGIRWLVTDLKFKDRIEKLATSDLVGQKALINEQNKYINNPSFQSQYTKEPIKSILIERGRIDRVDPRIMDFLFRACHKRTRPKNFDGILNI